MAFLRKYVEWLRDYYDRGIAGVMVLALLISLLYLAGHVGGTRRKQEDFDRQIESMRPAHPVAAALNTQPYEEALAALAAPVQIPAWTNALFVPEPRAWCVACFRPVPYDAVTCPHCDEPVPIDPEVDTNRDLDADGMKDVWEDEHGLNPRDASDAERDSDADGFLNIEEFRANPPTDPRNPQSFPPIEAKLQVTGIDADPFRLRFRSLIKMPDGEYKFGINTREQSRTYFVKLGEEVQGFKVEAFEPKSKVMEKGGITRRVDLSELTLRRGDQTIVLIKDVDVQYNEYTAHLLFTLDNSEYAVNVNGTLELRGSTYKVLEIDSANETVVLEREHDKVRFDIRRFPVQEND